MHFKTLFMQGFSLDSELQLYSNALVLHAEATLIMICITYIFQPNLNETHVRKFTINCKLEYVFTHENRPLDARRMHTQPEVMS